MSDKSISSNDICRALATKYAPPEWCLYFEVADDTGTRQKRWADAVAMSIWPSRGYQIHGFEVKVSRGDFLAEMKKPSKADAVGQYCDFWWLVVPKQMVVPEEIPETWGLMELTKAGLRVKKQAPKTEAATPTRGFMAALLRRGMDMQQAHVRKAIEVGDEARERRMADEVERRTKRLREETDKHREWIKNFESTLGMKFHTYQCPKKMAHTLKLAEKLAGEFSAVDHLRNSAAALVRDIDNMRDLRKQDDLKGLLG